MNSPEITLNNDLFSHWNLPSKPPSGDFFSHIAGLWKRLFFSPESFATLERWRVREYSGVELNWLSDEQLAHFPIAYLSRNQLRMLDASRMRSLVTTQRIAEVIDRLSDAIVSDLVVGLAGRLSTEQICSLAERSHLSQVGQVIEAIGVKRWSQVFDHSKGVELRRFLVRHLPSEEEGALTFLAQRIDERSLSIDEIPEEMREGVVEQVEDLETLLNLWSDEPSRQYLSETKWKTVLQCCTGEERSAFLGHADVTRFSEEEFAALSVQDLLNLGGTPTLSRIECDLLADKKLADFLDAGGRSIDVDLSRAKKVLPALKSIEGVNILIDNFDGQQLRELLGEVTDVQIQNRLLRDSLSSLCETGAIEVLYSKLELLSLSECADLGFEREFDDVMVGRIAKDLASKCSQKIVFRSLKSLNLENRLKILARTESPHVMCAMVGSARERERRSFLRALSTTQVGLLLQARRSGGLNWRGGLRELLAASNHKEWIVQNLPIADVTGLVNHVGADLFRCLTSDQQTLVLTDAGLTPQTLAQIIDDFGTKDPELTRGILSEVRDPVAVLECLPFQNLQQLCFLLEGTEVEEGLIDSSHPNVRRALPLLTSDGPYPPEATLLMTREQIRENLRWVRAELQLDAILEEQPDVRHVLGVVDCVEATEFSMIIQKLQQKGELDPLASEIVHDLLVSNNYPKAVAFLIALTESEFKSYPSLASESLAQMIQAGPVSLVDQFSESYLRTYEKEVGALTSRINFVRGKLEKANHQSEAVNQKSLSEQFNALKVESKTKVTATLEDIKEIVPSFEAGGKWSELGKLLVSLAKVTDGRENAYSIVRVVQDFVAPTGATYWRTRGKELVAKLEKLNQQALEAATSFAELIRSSEAIREKEDDGQDVWGLIQSAGVDTSSPDDIKAKLGKDRMEIFNIFTEEEIDDFSDMKKKGICSPGDKGAELIKKLSEWLADR